MKTRAFSKEFGRIWLATLVAVSIISTVSQAAGRECVDLFRRDFLTEQAAQYGLRVQTFREAFRFEGRKPSEILKAGGFTPNPAKPAGDLKDHSTPRSMGTNQFISFTLNGDNKEILGDGFLTEASRATRFPSRAAEQRYLDLFSPESLAKIKARPSEIEAELSQILGMNWEWGMTTMSRLSSYQALSAKEQAHASALDNEWLSANRRIYMLRDGPQPPQVVEFYEYRVEKVRAIRTGKLGVAKEQEIVADGVPATQITHVRKVSLIFYAGFVSLPNAKDPFYGQQLGLLLHDPATAPDIEFGQWRAFKKP